MRGDYVWAFHDDVEIGPKMLAELQSILDCGRRIYSRRGNLDVIDALSNSAVWACGVRGKSGSQAAALQRKPLGRLDAALDVGEVEPDFYAAEVGAFGTDWGGDAGAKMAGRADVPGELRMDFAELGDFVERGLINFFLGVEAGAHGPFVEEMEERAGFDEANGFGVGEQVERNFERDAAIEELVFGVPGVLHGAVVDFPGARIVFEKGGSDVVGLAGVGQGEQRA